MILKINNQEVSDSYSLTRAVAGLKPGSMVKIVVWRDGSEKQLKARLEKRSDEHVASLSKEEKEGLRTKGNSKEKQDKLGLKLMEITPEIALRYNLKDTTGLLVTGIDPEGSAASTEIKEGDIIKEINKHKISELTDYMSILSKAKRGDSVLLLVQRGENTYYIGIDIK